MSTRPNPASDDHASTFLDSIFATTPAANDDVRSVSSVSSVPTGQRQTNGRFKVYIGNLPQSATLEDLEDCFGAMGKVRCFLKKGFGFAEYVELSAAQEAVAKYHEGHFLGAQIKVEISRTQSGAQSAPVDAEGKVIIRNPPGSDRPSDLRKPKHINGPDDSDEMYGSRASRRGIHDQYGGQYDQNQNQRSPYADNRSAPQSQSQPPPFDTRQPQQPVYDNRGAPFYNENMNLPPPAQDYYNRDPYYNSAPPPSQYSQQQQQYPQHSFGNDRPYPAYDQSYPAPRQGYHPDDAAIDYNRFPPPQQQHRPQQQQPQYYNPPPFGRDPNAPNDPNWASGYGRGAPLPSTNYLTNNSNNGMTRSNSYGRDDGGMYMGGNGGRMEEDRRGDDGYGYDPRRERQRDHHFDRIRDDRDSRRYNPYDDDRMRRDGGDRPRTSFVEAREREEIRMENQARNARNLEREKRDLELEKRYRASSPGRIGVVDFNAAPPTPRTVPPLVPIQSSPKLSAQVTVQSSPKLPAQLSAASPTLASVDPSVNGPSAIVAEEDNPRP